MLPSPLNEQTCLWNEEGADISWHIASCLSEEKHITCHRFLEASLLPYGTRSLARNKQARVQHRNHVTVGLHIIFLLLYVITLNALFRYCPLQKNLISHEKRGLKVINNPERLAYVLRAKLGKSPNLWGGQVPFARYLHVNSMIPQNMLFGGQMLLVLYTFFNTLGTDL